MKRDLRLAWLWERYLSARDPADRAALIESYRYLVEITARRLLRGRPRSIELEDMESAGYEGLIRAIDTYHIRGGAQFTTYALHCIQGAIRQFLRDNDWVPRSVRDNQKRFARAARALRERLRRRPSDEEIVAELGISLAILDAWHAQFARQKLRSLDAPANNPKNPFSLELTLADVVADEAFDLEEIAEQDARLSAIIAAVGRLPQRDRLILCLYYKSEWTHKRIAERLGLSESRVYQLHAAAIRRLRQQWREREERE